LALWYGTGVYEIVYWPAADDALGKLESEPTLRRALQAVERILVQLAEDPFSPRLGTTAFVTEELGGISATPARFDDWYLLWQRGQESRTVEVVLICQLRI
jgi:hypothetical protein